MGTHRPRNAGSRVLRAVLAVTLVAGTTAAAVVTGAGVASAALPNPSPAASPAPGVSSQLFTSPGISDFTVPNGTLALTVLAQGGSGQNGGGVGGSGGTAGDAIAVHVPIGKPFSYAGAPASGFNPGDLLEIRVGGQGGSNSGSTCAGGNGGGGNEVGKGGGQGGQCSYVLDTTNGYYMVIAGGGGGGGGQGGGGGAGGAGGRGGAGVADSKNNALGEGGASGGSSGGGPDQTSCANSITSTSAGVASHGAGGQSAPGASDGGGGGGGGGGCGAGGGGGFGFEGGGGGAGGGSMVFNRNSPDMTGQDSMGKATSGGNGSVALYVSQGTQTTTAASITTLPPFPCGRIGLPDCTAPVNVPANAIAMEFLVTGQNGFGRSGGTGGIVYGNGAVGPAVGGPSSIVRRGDQLGLFGNPEPTNVCGGGAAGDTPLQPMEPGGVSNQVAGPGDGGECGALVNLFVHNDSGTTIAQNYRLGIAGGGGGTGEELSGLGSGGRGGDGGATTGQSGQTIGGSAGGAGGSCNGMLDVGDGHPGQGGTYDSTGFGLDGAGGGGGGGCGGGQGGHSDRVGLSSGGGGGGGGSWLAPGSITLSGSPTPFTGFTGTSFPGTNTAHDGFAHALVWFTIGSPPAVNAPNTMAFTEGHAGVYEIDPTGSPSPTLSESGALPNGVSFTDNHDGTWVIGGTPSPGTSGSYPITVTATNALGSKTQNVTVNVQQAPSFITSSSALFPQGQNTTFTVRTSGVPAATITKSVGSSETDLPPGVTFTPHSPADGTATLSGTPAAGTHDNYTFTLTASNGVGTPAVQHFTLTVQSAPFFTSAASTTFTEGTSGSFLVTTAGQPGANLQATSGPTGTGLPPGVTFTDNGNNGTGTLSGVPATNGVFTFQISATNVLGTAVQNFTLTVNGAPAFLSGNSYTYPGSGPVPFTVRTQAFPTASLSITGSLPSGITFQDNGNGTGSFNGTPTGGATFTINAKNTFGGSDHTTAQSFTWVTDGPPVFTSPDHADFTVGVNQTFTVQVDANPPAGDGAPGSHGIFLVLDGDPHHDVPNGLDFSYAGGNTATISGTPAATTSGTYTLTVHATSTAGQAFQTFTLRVFGPPVITSPASTIFAPGKVNTFNLSANGVPSATFSATLPSGIYSLLNDGNDQGRITGTPANSEEGAAYSFDITANNGHAPNDVQHFTLHVAASIQLTPAHQSVPAGNVQGYVAHAFDSNGTDLGAVTGGTTFTIADGNGCTTTPDPSSHVIFCSSNVAGDHTVTGTFGDLTATATLNVIARDPDHLVLTPDPATVLTRHDQAYDVKAYDTYGNLFSDVSSALNTLSMDGGSCDRTTDICTPSSDGAHTVTASYGTSTGTATLNSYTPVTLAQGNTSDDTTYGMPYTGQLTVTNGAGTVTWVPTTGDTSDITVGSDGSISAPATLPVGLYTVGGTNSTPRGDTGTWTFSLQVNPATLTVTASDAGTPYKGPAPTSTPTYSGFVNGEDESVLTGNAVCVVDYTVGQGAGVYPGGTHCTGGSAPNYTVDHVAGELDVFALQLTVTASSGSGPYGSTPPAITPSYSGFASGEGPGNLSPQASCSTTATSSSDAGSYPTTCSGAVDSNYGFKYVDGTYRITPVNLKITAPSQSLLVGTTIPTTFTPTYTGLTNGDTAPHTPPTCTSTGVTGSPIGTYPITCTGAVDGNYNISYQAGTLSIVGHATTTALAIPGTALPGHPINATATVAPVTPGAAPTGTVSFYAGYVSVTNKGTLLGSAPLNGAATDQAPFTIPFAVPGAQITAEYNGDSYYASSASPPVTINAACTSTITGTFGKSLTINSGLTCVTNANVRGSITVNGNGSLFLYRSSLGSLTIHGTANVCGSTMPSVTVANATGLVVFGDTRAGCAGNTVSGAMTFRSNLHGLVVVGNTYRTTLTANNNSGTGDLPGDTGPVIQGNRRV